MKSIFFGPSELSGIGQVTRTLSRLVHGDYLEFGQPLDERYPVGFCFVIPIPDLIKLIKERYAVHCDRMVYMTVCETETVHEYYQGLFELSDTIWTPSDFASRILKRQFPQGTFPVLRHYASPCVHGYTKMNQLESLEDSYVFYHIGNVIDPRKNIKAVIETFLRLDLPKSVLLLKATCNRPVHWRIPGIVVVEGLLSKEELEYIHHIGDCYVSFSHSEGAGMGAIEAAMRNKQVIIPEYGAGVEYIDTPYVIPCKEKRVGVDDFLFKKDMIWGDPDRSHLEKFMRDAYTNKRPGKSQKTHDIMARVPLELLEIMSDH